MVYRAKGAVISTPFPSSPLKGEGERGGLLRGSAPRSDGLLKGFVIIEFLKMEIKPQLW